MGITIDSVGAFVPDGIETNDDLSQQLSTSDEWIRARTGIQQRHIVSFGETTADLAVEAGRRALTAAGRGGIGLVVVATSTPDRSCPATAPMVAARLGLTGVPAFDVAAVCSGFLYALLVAEGLMTSLHVKSALVIGADTFSTILDPEDRGTRCIFGDGAGAFVLSSDDAAPDCILGRDLGSDGSGYELITRPASGSGVASDIKEGLSPYFRMAGKSVFLKAVEHMQDSCHRALSDAGLGPEDIDRLVAHQANARILRVVAESIPIHADRVISNIKTLGNTVAASIPLAIHHALSVGDLAAGNTLLMTGFGGGLTWGSTVIKWPAVNY